MAGERVYGGRVRAVKGGARLRRSREVARRTFIDGVHVANTRVQGARRVFSLFSPKRGARRVCEGRLTVGATLSLEHDRGHVSRCRAQITNI